MLEVTDLHVHYGKIQALHGVTLNIEEGEIVALIGANGAGKTTTLKTLSGLRSVTSGSVVFKGQDITKVPGHERVALGMSQVPEGRGVFPGMTVLENLQMGAYGRRDNISSDLDRAFTLFPRLKERETQRAGTMSGGEQQMLAIGRALMSRPQLLLLDEPSMGLAPKIIQLIFQIITEINAAGTTILLVEQNAAQALRIANRGYVLETGAVVQTGTGAALADDPKVRAAYLGTGAAVQTKPTETDRASGTAPTVD
ncbi:MAG: transporter ATP-binding protein [Frankiales bacterium]|nr:transporter ATP-binding protein [Frankiales bacterium]